MSTLMFNSVMIYMVGLMIGFLILILSPACEDSNNWKLLVAWPLTVIIFVLKSIWYTLTRIWKD